MANHTAGMTRGDTPLSPPPDPLASGSLGLDLFSSLLFFLFATGGLVGALIFFDGWVGLDHAEESRVEKVKKRP